MALSIVLAGGCMADGLVLDAPDESIGQEQPLLITDTGLAWNFVPEVPGQNDSSVLGANARFGSAIAAGADINGDGIPDVVFGAPKLHGDGTADAGGVYVFQGGVVPGEAVLSIGAFAADDQAGTSVALGDFDGDGLADLAVGAPNVDGGGTDRGAVYVYFSEPATTGGDIAFSAVPEVIEPSLEDGAHCGQSVAAVGETDDGGRDTLVVGCPDHDGNFIGEGLVGIYQWDPNPMTQAFTEYAYGGETSGLFEPMDYDQARFGAVVASAGDVDADGYADIIIGAPFFGVSGNNAGSVYAITATSTLQITLPPETGENPNAQFGAAVAGAGDINGDGAADVLVGAPMFGDDDRGKVFIYWGSPELGLNDASKQELTLEPSTAPGFGSAVAGAGDLNGDGFADFAIGQPLGGASARGRVFVYAGSSSPLEEPEERSGADFMDSRIFGFGSSLAAGGDLRGPTYGELIVGAPTSTYYTTGVGIAKSYRGAVFANLPNLILIRHKLTTATDDGFGSVVARIGDLHRDGFDDAVIGAPSHANGRGAVYVYKGGIDPQASEPTLLATGTQTDEELGSSFAAGDINGDGYADVVVGAPGAIGAGTDATDATGAATVYWGNELGPTAENSMTLQASGLTRFGSSIAVDDLDGDGFQDVLVGSPAANGLLYVYLGPSLDTEPMILLPTEDDGTGQQAFGSAIATGDFDCDGLLDIAIGAPSFDATDTPNSGRVYLYYGKTKEVSPLDVTLASDNAFGASMANLGDIRFALAGGEHPQDGCDDLAIGAPGRNEMRIYLGSPTGLSRTAVTDFLSPGGGAAQFGGAVASGGIINRDVHPTILVTGADRAFITHTSAFGLQELPFAGSAVAGLGDVNGDSFSDFIVGDGTTATIVYGGDHVVLGLDRQLRQRGVDGNLLASGNEAVDTIRLEGRVTQEDPIGGKLRLEVEVEPVGTLFDGLRTRLSEPVASGQIAGVEFKTLGPGAYKWRARVVYPAGRGASRWLHYGVGMPGADFLFNPCCAATDPPVAQPPLTDNSEESFYGCSTSSSHGALALVLAALGLAARRRRKRQPARR